MSKSKMYYNDDWGVSNKISEFVNKMLGEYTCIFSQQKKSQEFYSRFWTPRTSGVKDHVHFCNVGYRHHVQKLHNSETMCFYKASCAKRNLNITVDRFIRFEFKLIQQFYI